MLAQDADRSERLEGGNVAATRHDKVWRPVAIIASPIPNADAGCTVTEGCIHREPLRGWMLACNYNIDVMPAAQAMIDDGQQAVCIGWQIHPHYLRFLVHHMVDEARILMRESIVVLAPDMRCKKVVQGRDRAAPWNLSRDLQPLCMLVKHRSDDVNECLVAIEQAVPAGEQVTLQPAFALVLAEH